MIDLYSYKGAYPYELPAEMESFDIADFLLAAPKPDLAPGQVLEWTGTNWLVRDPNDAELALEIHRSRENRNKLLLGSDWTQVADAPVDKAAGAAYRQTLRDITEQSQLPWAINWPVAP